MNYDRKVSLVASIVSIILSGGAALFAFENWSNEASKIIVIDRNKEIVTDATITVELQNNKFLTETTNERGLVKIRIPKSSKKFPATVRIEAPGYQSYTQKIQTAADLPTVAIIENN